jgi:hypothetical protein
VYTFCFTFSPPCSETIVGIRRSQRGKRITSVGTNTTVANEEIEAVTSAELVEDVVVNAAEPGNDKGGFESAFSRNNPT